MHLGHKPRRSWAEAVLRWLDETSHKATHHQDKGKLVLLDDFLGSVMLDQIDSDLIDQIKRFLIKDRSRSTCNRYLALIRHSTNLNLLWFAGTEPELVLCRQLYPVCRSRDEYR